MHSWKENFKKRQQMRKCCRARVMLKAEWGAGCSQQDLVKNVGKPGTLGCKQHGGEGVSRASPKHGEVECVS